MTRIWEGQVYANVYWADNVTSLKAEDGSVDSAEEFIRKCHQAIGLSATEISCAEVEGNSSNKQTLYPKSGFPFRNPPIEPGSMASTAWIYRVHDVVCALFGISLGTASSMRDLASVSERFGLLEDQSPHFLGGALVYVARSEPGANTRLIATELFGIAPDGAGSTIMSASLQQPITVFRLEIPGTPWERFVVLLPEDEACDDSLVTPFLMVTLPDIIRILFKIRHLSGDQYRRVKIAIAEAEKRLGHLDARATNLIEAEENLAAISRVLADFSTFLTYLCKLRLSVSINITNLATTLSGFGKNEGGWLEEVPAAAKAALDEIESDIAYCEIKARQSQVKLDALRIGTELLRVRTEKAETKAIERGSSLIALIGLSLAAFQAFDGDTTKLIWNCMMCGCALVDLAPFGLRLFVVLVITGCLVGLYKGVRGRMDRAPNRNKRGLTS